MHAFSFLSAILAASSLVSSAAIARRHIGEDEILVFGDNGRHEIVKLADYQAELARTNTTIGRPESPFDNVDSWESPVDGEGSNSTDSDVEKRCTSTKLIVRNKDIDFLDWDVPMSSAFHATNSPGTISVSGGHTVQDTLTTSSSVDFPFIKSVISASVGITFTQQWTSTYNTAYTSTVPKGKWGIMVSNPRVYRRSGYAKVGCIGSQRSTYFQADQHFSNDYKGLSWVQGSISLCTSNSYPIKQCNGNGYNH
ncbi:hypothetical protein ONS96_014864 [Cadophora gregata f. sp. sojae]|nr:hypothetical protein ONS96_014864 [Cadophora gregata f. sp. sojae]